MYYSNDFSCVKPHVQEFSKLGFPRSLKILSKKSLNSETKITDPCMMSNKIQITSTVSTSSPIKSNFDLITEKKINRDL